MKADIELVQRWFGYDPDQGHLLRLLKYRDDLSDVIYPSKDGRVYLLGKRYPYTHIVWAVHHGKWPDGEIDHIDRNELNNKLVNLRDVTSSQNKWNRRSWNSIAKGVTFNNSTARVKPWVARISAHGKSTFLGSFKTHEEAAQAYKEASEKLHGEFACYE